jgi:GrpB-like predicted nucleotidyltransferase (UPF0157 family)
MKAIKLENYNPKWSEEYKKEEELLKSLLGNKIRHIEHVGSTAIEGVKAKPIIDILVVIKDMDQIPEIENILKDYGYENKGSQGFSDRMFFVKGPLDNRKFYVHFTKHKSITYCNQIYFKRYLNEHIELMQQYSDLKANLARKYPHDNASYTSGKNDFIAGVLKLARRDYHD